MINLNIKELNESVKENRKSDLEENIKEIENRIRLIASNGLNYFKIATYDYNDYYYTIKKWAMKPLRDYFENEGYKIEVKEVKGVTKWLQKLLSIYEPDYIIIISWDEIN